MAKEARKTLQQQFTTVLEGLTRQNRELQAELAQKQTASSKRDCGTQAGGTNSPARATDDGSRCGQGCGESQVTSRGLRILGGTGAQCSGCTLAQQCQRLQKLVTEAANSDPQCHGVGRRISGSIGAVSLDDADVFLATAKVSRLGDN